MSFINCWMNTFNNGRVDCIFKHVMLTLYIMENDTFNRYKETIDPVTLQEIDKIISSDDFFLFSKIGKDLFGKEFEWFVDMEIDLAEKSDKKRLERIKARINSNREIHEQMWMDRENDAKMQQALSKSVKEAREYVFHEFREKQDIILGRVSMILCMIAAIYIAVIPESIFSAVAWMIYSVGAMTGILHLKRINEISTGVMYVIWFILDLCAIIRLLFVFFA